MTFSKTGRGAFYLSVDDEGIVTVSFRDDKSDEKTFENAEAAYDYYRPGIEGNHAFWNVCYHLEDVINGDLT